MKKRYNATILLAMACMTGLGPTAARAVNDGRGTNYVNTLRVTAIELGQELRTNWPSVSGSIGGTARDISNNLNQVTWGSAITWNGQLQKAQMQVDSGIADVHVIRSLWNDAWGSCTTLNTLRVTTSGVEDAAWTSAWVSNDYRIGIVVTNCTTGSNLWWSISYTKD